MEHLKKLIDFVENGFLSHNSDANGIPALDNNINKNYMLMC